MVSHKKKSKKWFPAWTTGLCGSHRDERGWKVWGLKKYCLALSYPTQVESDCLTDFKALDLLFFLQSPMRNPVQPLLYILKVLSNEKKGGVLFGIYR